MSPRPYRMGKRAQAVEQTRRRILEAALDEYAETGIDAASMQSIARRADVAPGTVLYHYPDPGTLAEAVMAARTQAMAVPTADAVDAQRPVQERVRWVTGELFRVYAATDREYHAWLRSRDHPVMRAYEQWYDQAYRDLLAAALGPENADPRAFQVASALVDPGFRASLVTRGLSDDEAVEETTRLVTAWLQRPRR